MPVMVAVYIYVRRDVGELHINLDITVRLYTVAELPHSQYLPMTPYAWFTLLFYLS